MQPSETFLFVWSIGASLTASIFYFQAKRAEHRMGLLMQSIVDIHDGKAQVIKRGDNVTVRYIGENNDDNASQ